MTTDPHLWPPEAGEVLGCKVCATVHPARCPAHRTHLTPDEARDLITRVIGPVDRPWVTRCTLALSLVRRHPIPTDPPVADVEAAIVALGYPLREQVPEP